MTTEVYSFQLGDFECVAAKDFSNEFSLGDLVPNAEKEQLAEAAQELGLGPDVITADYVCLLIRTGKQNVLVDAGWGTRSEGRQGKLLEGLQAIGVEPDGIDWIIITHGDRDHISGILDEEDRPVYPRARYVLWQGAWEFWANEENYADWPQDIVAFITGTYATIRDRLELVGAEEEFLPGFQLVPAVGHRYDHAVLRVSSQGKQLLHLADAVVHPIHMAHRGWYSMFDTELEQATAIKQQLLDWAVEENALVFGAHFPFPSVGYVRHGEEGWQWLPLAVGTHDQAAILALYGDGPARLEAALAGLAAADLDTALTEDSWTIRQIVHHVADGDDLWKIGLKAALGDTEGTFAFQWYWDIPQDSWVERWAYASRPIEPSLALLRASRRQVVQLMQQVPDAWGRSIRVRWPNGQEQQVTAGGLVEMQAHHVLGHIQDIHQIRRKYNLGNAVI